MKINIRGTLGKYKRVLILARKPDSKELKDTARICAVGVFIIGIMGFVFYVISVLGGA